MKQVTKDTNPKDKSNSPDQPVIHDIPIGGIDSTPTDSSNSTS